MWAEYLAQNKISCPHRTKQEVVFQGLWYVSTYDLWKVKAYSFLPTTENFEKNKMVTLVFSEAHSKSQERLFKFDAVMETILYNILESTSVSSQTRNAHSVGKHIVTVAAAVALESQMR